MPDRKKIILVYSTAGLGHKKAALALESVIKTHGDRAEVKAVDIMEYASSFYRFIYLDLYVFLMKKARWLWAFMFYVSDNVLFDIMARKIRGRLDYSGVRSLEDLLREEKADAVVATHFLVTSIALILKSRGVQSKLFAVVTDYGPHAYWVSRGVDKYFVGCEWTRSELIRKGVPGERIVVTGIPTTGEFHEEHDTTALKKHYGVDPDRKTVFIMSGGFGVGPVGKMLKAMKDTSSRIQVIAVCGHNEKLYSELEDISGSLNYPVKLFGFTDKVAELMAISDLMITKAGGISVTEAMDSELPMVLYGSIPGQETWNEKMLLEAGAAELAKSINDIPRIVDHVFGSQDTYYSFKKSIREARKPFAARDITREVMES